MPPHADVLQWEHLPFPKSLRDFQKLFPDDAACARYLEGAKWPKGFTCPHCQEKGEPVRLATRPGVLACRACRKQTSLTVDTVMQRTHTPLTVWFWAAYLVSSMTPGMSAVQFQRQLGLTRYETAFQILHKLRAGMVRQGRDRIGGNQVCEARGCSEPAIAFNDDGEALCEDCMAEWACTYGDTHD